MCVFFFFYKRFEYDEKICSSLIIFYGDYMYAVTYVQCQKYRKTFTTLKNYLCSVFLSLKSIVIYCILIQLYSLCIHSLNICIRIYEYIHCLW